MERLNILIELNGVSQRVGTIVGNNSSDAVFQYDDEYLSIDRIRPISVHLPLQREAFTVQETASFFEGLLPEGFSRRAVANWAKSDENDYLSILKKLGQECLGALQVTEKEHPIPAGYYELLSPAQVKALAAEGATKSTRLLMETHLSLTGASGKVGLYYDEAGSNWYLPLGNAPSTHIVKQSHVRLGQIVLNEQICVRTANKIGIEVPRSFIIDVGSDNTRARISPHVPDSDVLYATERYDRRFLGSVSFDGTNAAMTAPARLHQEDFAQALGIPASQKYETTKQGYLGKMFELIRTQSSNPLEDQVKLWDMICFHFLIGNTDCHLKNYSLLYNPDLRGIRLAPAYDIVCSSIYNSSKEMSFFVGEEVNITRIDRSCFVNAAREAGLGLRLAMRHFDDLANRYEAALDAAAEEIAATGFADAPKLRDRILETCGYRNL